MIRGAECEHCGERVELDSEFETNDGGPVETRCPSCGETLQLGDPAAPEEANDRTLTRPMPRIRR